MAGCCPRTILAADWRCVICSRDFSVGFSVPRVIATEATKTAPRRTAGAESQARGQKARDRYVEVAAALKAPAGTTRRQLYILAHECGHIVLHSTTRTWRKPRHGRSVRHRHALAVCFLACCRCAPAEETTGRALSARSTLRINSTRRAIVVPSRRLQDCGVLAGDCV
jgi:hypothetical protein